MFSYSVLKEINKVSKNFKRFKNPPNHWSVLRKKVQPVDKALAHFDDFYKQVFQKKWISIREGLLSKQKYVAVVNNYGDSEETRVQLELNGALNLRILFNLEKDYIKEELQTHSRKKLLDQISYLDRKLERESQKVSLKENEDDLLNSSIDARECSLQSSLNSADIDYTRIIDSKNALSTEKLNEFVPATEIKGKEDFIFESTHYKMFDKHLNIYCYEKDNKTQFDGATKSSTGVTNYYLMDGGSILPVLALDLKPGSKMLDMCASPGGKSLLALQTLYPNLIVTNDISHSRVQRIKSVFKEFIYDFDENWLKSGKIHISNRDARFIEDKIFDRILVDVPCTTDRHSLKENDNNIFKPSRIKERLKLPELQAELLFNALNIVKRGGIVVYSTCSLSPIQNDGVVGMALRKLWEETDYNAVVKDLTPALLQTRSVYNIAHPNLVKLGHLVLPSKSQNYGPTYFCKIQKI
ncbi:hypothetical protein GWI33_008493 [Rhynchophorus ferrugineus]|uniref:NOL1/NOP2/Sun domain family member 4 n=1 Tax=Rhynchophorus ferrugineus TaxID=354439 RepID=A0A834IG37_RHYFE|nr:hypothetical protein GWI33_008493 [Rhynchophorus ferrugineus]